MLELEVLAQRELLHHVGDEDRTGVGYVTDPGGKVHGRPIQVIVFGYRLAGGESDPHMNFVGAGVAVVGFEFLLHGEGATDGTADRLEAGHDPVPGVLHLAAGVLIELFPDDPVVIAEHCHGHIVA